MEEKVKAEIVEELRKIVGGDWVVTERDLMIDYLRDETADPVCPTPSLDTVLVKPLTTGEVSKILKLANKLMVPVFPAGGRTGLVGGSIPVKPGIILSLERMNKIEIDRDNLMAIAGAGVTLSDLIKAAEDADLFFPLHPGDEGAQIGGLIAANAGGVRAVKYGVMRSYVKGLEVVLPTGEALNLGGELLKNNAGYDLMNLVIGSEGTLCVITKAVIRLYPKTRFSVSLLIPFKNGRDAIKSVPEILQAGIIPLAIEYMETEGLKKTAEHLNEEWPTLEGEAQLLLILTGMNEDELLSECEQISEICQKNNSSEAVLAETREEQDKILKVRSNIYTVMKPEVYDILDVTVPPSKLAMLVDRINEIEERHGIRLPIYGHAGDGNLHVHIMWDEGRAVEYAEDVKREVYGASSVLGGVITGEHGIGRTRVKDFSFFADKKEIELMKAIKKVFDPNGILNPGKVLELNAD